MFPSGTSSVVGVIRVTKVGVALLGTRVFGGRRRLVLSCGGAGTVGCSCSTYIRMGDALDVMGELMLLKGSSMIVRLGAAVDGADVGTNVGVGFGVSC